jgi:hypothetical protein
MDQNQRVELSLRRKAGGLIVKAHIVPSCLVTGEFSVYSWLVRASSFLPGVWFRGVQRLQLAGMEGSSLLPAV